MNLEDKLNYYKIGLSSGIIKINEFLSWLDYIFMKKNNDILLDLESCNGVDDVIKCINEYFHKIKYNENPYIAIRVILRKIKTKYKKRRMESRPNC